MQKQCAKLLRAKLARNDEFYTQYADVESECDHYRSHFLNKCIYCNCDTADSAFVKYFTKLKSQGLIRDVWFSGGLGGTDFRSPQAIELLQRADVVVTNPPFSLFRDFMDLLIEYQKPFLVIGNKNAIAQRKVFDLVKRNKIWPGVRRWAGGMRFIVPDDADTKEVPAIWLTNLPHSHRPLPIPLSVSYNPKLFPNYDNADAINVNRTADIPFDYDGIMGVPISFIERYNPAQFEILGLDKDFTSDTAACSVLGQRIYTRVFIRKRLAN
ncbi:MAG: adenosine deaminase [Alphaproteobacteria bacterium]|nr:adenosine deaminase [Alphaproteobacteria bacterium]